MNDIRRMRPLLGTFVSIGAYGQDKVANAAINDAFAVIESIHRALSFQDPDSELSRLNRKPGQWVAISSIGLNVLRLAQAMGRASRERFNCTVGAQLVARGMLPDQDWGARLAVGCHADVQLDRGRVRLRRRVLLTLDGIAKGYAVDRAIDVLRRHGLPGGWVNAGGDLRVYGERPLEVLRREVQGEHRALTWLDNAAIASSLNSANVADPSFSSSLVGNLPGEEADEVISVRASRAWRADALTKVAAATPGCERRGFIAQLGGTLLSSGTAHQP